jgi:hypothetical protein
MNESIFMPMALIPFSLADFYLMPTAWVYRPRFVNLNKIDTRIANTMTIRIGVGIGTPGMKLPI